MKRNILLLTGNGFLGRNLILHLNKKKNNIFFFTRKKNSQIPKIIKVCSEDIFKIKKLQIKNSVVILTTLNNSDNKFYLKFEKLLEKIFYTKPIKVILISSVSIYAKKQTSYSKNCKLAENICKKKFKKLVILRAGNIFGEYKKNLSYIEKLLISSINNSKFTENKINLIRSYIHVEEFCKAVSKVINNKTFGHKIYNLSNKNYIFSSYQIKKILSKKLGFKIYSKKKIIKTHILKSIIKSKKFEKDFNFKFENKFLKRLVNLRNYYKNFYFNKNSF